MIKNKDINKLNQRNKKIKDRKVEKSISKVVLKDEDQSIYQMRVWIYIQFQRRKNLGYYKTKNVFMRFKTHQGPEKNRVGFGSNG